MSSVWPPSPLVFREVEVFETGFIEGEGEKNCFKAGWRILDSRNDICHA